MVKFASGLLARQNQNGRAPPGRRHYDKASRYDPTTMGRVHDSASDLGDGDDDLEDRIDPPHLHNGGGINQSEREFFDHVHSDLDSLHVAQRMRYRPSPRLRRCMLCFLGAAALVGAVVGVFVTVLDGRDAYESSLHGAGLASPPKDLSEVCSVSAVQQPGGYPACQAYCVRAECCFLPEGHWFSCKSNHAKECATYESACMVLDEGDLLSPSAGGDEKGDGQQDDAGPHKAVQQMHVTIDPAPAGLDEICGPDSLRTPAGFQSCTDSCQSSECCTQPIELCKVDNPAMCDAYEPCAVLHSMSNTNTHPDSVASQVKAKCNTANLLTAGGVKECEDFCHPALCCFVDAGETMEFSLTNDPAGATVEGCLDEERGKWCDQYLGCMTVLHVKDDDGFSSDEDATQHISEACDHLETPKGRDQCKSMCDPAECCFVGMDGCDAQGLADINCDHYEACYPLFDQMSGETAQQVMVPRPPANLESICAGLDLDGNPEGRQKCADACSAAQCCVTDIEVCKVVNPQMCGPYEVQCAQVWDEPYREVTIPDPPADLESTCAGVSTADEKFKVCDAACRPARCCDEDIAVCKVLNPHMCDAYEVHCAVVWGDMYHEVTIPKAPVDIDRKCAGAELSKDKRDTCDEACRPARCCDEDIEVCKVLNPQACEPYEVHCAQVWGDQYQEVNIPSAPKELADVCRAGSGTAGLGDDSQWSRCADLCYMAKCCSEDIESCKVLNPRECDAYETPCSNFWGDSVTIPPASSALRQYCTAESVRTVEGFNKCQDECNAADCCDKPMGTCRVTNPDVCGQYDPCSVLFDITPDETDGSIEVPPAPSGLSAVCSPQSLGNVRGFTDCEDKCDRARCCLEEPGDCNVRNPEVCDDYVEPCTALYDFKVKGTAVNERTDDVVAMMDLAKEVVEVCDDDNLMEIQGRNHCEHLCNGRECCFETDQTKNCVKDKREECLAFAACEAIFSSDTSSVPPGDREPDNSGTTATADGDSNVPVPQVKVPYPPSNLEAVCSGKALDSPEGHQKCADACSAAQCCVSDINVCKVTNPAMCGPYEVQCAQIWNLPYKEVTIPDPPADLESTCTGVSTADENFKQCDIACRPARCCDEDIAVCKVLNPHMCDAYEVHCAVVWGDAYHEVTIPEAPVDIDRKCAGAELSKDKRDTCDDACRPARCCDEDIEVCKVLNPQACEPYEVHCAQVWGDQYQEVNIPVAPKEIADVCKAGSGASGGDDTKWSQCGDLCYMAKCCSEDIESCKVRNPGECAAYKDPCANFWGDSVTIPAPTSALKQYCTPESVRTVEGFNKCQDQCNEADCCNKPMGTCRVVNPEVCDQYEPCSLLFDITPDEDDGTIEVPPAPPGLAAVCSPHSLASVTGFTDCEDECDRARCCLEGGDYCDVKNPDVCPSYVEPCTALYDFKVKGTTTNENTGDAVDMIDLAEEVIKACDDDSLREIQGRQHCEHLCDGRLCCFESDDQYNCANDRKDECLAFAACEGLLTPQEAISSVPTETKPTAMTVDDACTDSLIKTANGRQKCEQICSQRSCCFAEGTDNCYATDKHWCGEYNACKKLQTPKPTSRPTSQPTENDDDSLTNEVDEICGPDKLRSKGGLAICHQVCDPHFCCWDTKSSVNCYSDNLGECDNFKGCLALYEFEGIEVQLPGEPDGEGADEGLESEVETLCAIEKLKKKETLQICHEVCDPHACCWDKDETKNCYPTQPKECNAFVGCEQLYEYEA